MPNSLFASWHLFADAWLSSWLIAGLLSLLGVAVLARGQIFLGAAMSQAATAGVALVLCCAGSITWRAQAEAVAAMLAAVVTAFAVGASRHRGDALAAWIFLSSGSAAVLLVAQSPYGMDEINRLLASSIVGAHASDVVVFATLGLIVGGVALGNASRLRVLLLDPAFAAAIGIRVVRWEVWLAVVLGLSLGWSLHVAGLLYTFGALILPAMAVRLFSRELATMAWLTPVLAVGCAILGSCSADIWDLPPAQVVVAFWSGSVALAGFVRFLRTLAR
jgi:ABC-type Mn2+/Zn2+ transport system permease subunit